MLEVCRQRVAVASGTAQVELVRANALALPFGAEFDIVVCFGALGHILQQDEPQLVGQIARVLKPGGRFVFVSTYLPSVWSWSYWLARTFNGAMRLRNLLWSPPFIMYYLTFLLPEAQLVLEREGLTVEVRELARDGPWAKYRLVTSMRRF
jgi:ubiquinone/menaquinone biosynthesis C-methylase UbiE